MTKLTNMIEGRTTGSVNVSFKREIAVKFNAKIATTSRWIKMIVAESNGGRDQFRTLPICTNKKVFSFRWINRKSVRGEPRTD